MASSPDLEASGSTSRSRGASRYRPEIDGLRAFAVIAVIINHFNKNFLPGGYLGVDIFFVISGFVISLSLIKGIQSSSMNILSEFYVRRIKRILPALIVCILATYLCIQLFVKATGEFMPGAIGSLLGVSNIIFSGASGYFGAQLELNPFTHTWSLGVEEQFYLVYPIIFIILFKFNPKRTLSIVTLCIFFVASLIYWATGIQQSSHFFSSPARAWEILAGCIAFLISSQIKTRRSSLELISTLLNKSNRSIKLACTVGLLLIMALLDDEHILISTPSVVFITFLLIIFQEFSNDDSFLSSPTSRWIGKRSYSLYLWHWPTLVIMRWTIGIDILTGALGLAFIFLTSQLSYRYVETPFRKLDAKGVCSVRHILMALGLSIASIVSYQSFFSRSLFIGNSPALSEKFSDKYVKEQRILFIGDSHAEHLAGLARELDKQSILESRIFSYSLISFPLTDHEPKTLRDWINPKKVATANINNRLNRLFSKLVEGDILVVSERNSLNLDSPNAKPELNRLINRGINIVIFRPLYGFEADKSLIYNASDLWRPEACEREWFRSSYNKTSCMSSYKAKINRSTAQQVYTSKNLALSRYAKGSNSVYIFDPNETICPSDQNQCESSIRGVQIYRDDDHLTIAGSALLKKDFLQFLSKNKLIKNH